MGNSHHGSSHRCSGVGLDSTLVSALTLIHNRNTSRYTPPPETTSPKRYSADRPPRSPPRCIQCRGITALNSYSYCTACHEFNYRIWPPSYAEVGRKAIINHRAGLPSTLRELLMEVRPAELSNFIKAIFPRKALSCASGQKGWSVDPQELDEDEYELYLVLFPFKVEVAPLTRLAPIAEEIECPYPRSTIPWHLEGTRASTSPVRAEGEPRRVKPPGGLTV